MVVISEDGYQTGPDKCKHMLLGHLQLAKVDKPYSLSDLHQKLNSLWGDLGRWQLIPMGKGYYTFNFASVDLGEGCYCAQAGDDEIYEMDP